MFLEKLKKLEQAGLLRKMRRIDSAQGPRVTLDGKLYLLMSGNNYLDLAMHPMVRQAASEAVQKFGVGSGGSRLICGNMLPHEQLEQQWARFKGTEAALVFSTGYMANLAALACLIPENGLLLLDRLCHASLIDGARLSGRKFRTFGHKNLERLESLLKGKSAQQPALIVTEGVFSMEGDLSPLPQLLTIARKFGARVLLDDAHGTGVMGRNGRGTMEHFGLDPDSEDIVQMGTHGKALGSFGAFIAGKREAIDYLTNMARPFIYTTALPPALCAATGAALEVIEQEPDRLARLWANREYLFRGIQTLGFNTLGSESPILAIAFPDVSVGTFISDMLYDLGILIPPIRPPTVPRGTSRLRITVTAAHTREDLDSVLTALARAQDQLTSASAVTRAISRKPNRRPQPARSSL